MTGIHSVCVHTGRIARQHHAEHGRLRLITYRHAAFLHAESALENGDVQPAREGVEDLVHVIQHEVVFFHVELAHVFRQPGGSGLLPREVVRRLLAIAQRQRLVEIEVAGLLHHLHQILDGNLAQHFARAIGLAHVAREQTGIGLAHLGQDLSGAVITSSVSRLS